MRKIIEVPESVASYLERLDYDQQATRMLMLDAVERDLEHSEVFGHWEARYRENYAAFLLGKSELERNYVQPNVKGKKYNWSLDYGTRKLEISVEEGQDETA